VGRSHLITRAADVGVDQVRPVAWRMAKPFVDKRSAKIRIVRRESPDAFLSCCAAVVPPDHGLQRPHFGRVRLCLFPRPGSEDPVLGQLVGDAQHGRIDVLIVGRDGYAGPESRRPALYRVTHLLTRLVESGRRESNPHGQLGRLDTHFGWLPQFVAVTGRYIISNPLGRLFG
jgi:hypothetical protein